MFQVIIVPSASADIRDSALWYEQQQKGLGRRFTEQVKKKVHFIRQHPESYSVKYDHCRTAILKTFPYMIHYLVEEDRELIVILAVLHTSRSPQVWPGRK